MRSKKLVYTSYTQDEQLRRLIKTKEREDKRREEEESKFGIPLDNAKNLTVGD